MEQRGPWRVGRDARGRLAIFDEHGSPILATLSADPVTALEVAYLAGAAPSLANGVRPLVRRLERIEVDHGIPIMGRDEGRIGELWLALHESVPPYREYTNVWASRNQLELAWVDHVA